MLCTDVTEKHDGSGFSTLDAMAWCLAPTKRATPPPTIDDANSLLGKLTD